MSSPRRPGRFPRDPSWYKDAIIYELHVRAFRDSDGDGMGDFRGLTEKLDYLKDLGVTALWILPFYPSPWRDDGYDISDYNAVHPAYGTLRDFKAFVKEAHQRELRVITELVLNHTSDQHPWFQKSRQAAPGSPWRDFYVWSDTPDRYGDARIIFKDFESSNWSWDPVAKAYYWHRFYSHQPDLNFENPAVQDEMIKIVDAWFRMDIDGLRLDAVPYLFEEEGTSCENLPRTHAFLKRLRAHIDEKYADRMLLAEANQWPEEAVAYFGDDDECHMAFHFPLMPRMFMAIRMEDQLPIVDTFEHTPEIPPHCQWALFLRNHDELTLEMVTDSERDYMYDVYASDPQARINLGIRRRLAPLLENNRRKIELMNTLLFSLPGTPVLYYGDEIGMGDNIYLGDRNSVRTPIHWSADRNAGFSSANPQRLFLPIIIDSEYHYQTVNVEAQESNPHSLLSWTKRLIAMRKRYKVFGRGGTRFLQSDNNKVLAFIREHDDETILVVANLSRFAQYIQLDLSWREGAVPVELFGGTRFPQIGALPYLLTIGPHGAYWFLLESGREQYELEAEPEHVESFQLSVSSRWEEVLSGRSREALEARLPDYLCEAPWFTRKHRKIRSVVIHDELRFELRESRVIPVIIQVSYAEGEPETYLLPLAYAGGGTAQSIIAEQPSTILARIHNAEAEEDGVLFDASNDPIWIARAYELIRKRRRIRIDHGTLRGTTYSEHRAQVREAPTTPIKPIPQPQRNSSAVIGEAVFLKTLRRLQSGVNVEIELGRYLGGEESEPTVPSVYGTLEYQKDNGDPTTLAVLQQYLPNDGDAWSFTRTFVHRFLDEAIATPDALQRISPPTPNVLDLAQQAVPEPVAEALGEYVDRARLLGKRTAQMHLKLAAATDPAFAPETFTGFHRRALSYAINTGIKNALRELRRRVNDLPFDVQDRARYLIDREDELRAIPAPLRDQRISAQRIRCHGYFHLRQVLVVGDDFAIIDFEGEPKRRLSERRLRNSPLRDVAGMLRSFHYAASSCQLERDEALPEGSDERMMLQPAAVCWQTWVSAIFLRAYFDQAADGEFLPSARDEQTLLLDAFLLDRAMYEVGNELERRPEWLRIPLDGILQLVQARRVPR